MKFVFNENFLIYHFLHTELMSRGKIRVYSSNFLFTSNELEDHMQENGNSSSSLACNSKNNNNNCKDAKPRELLSVLSKDDNFRLFIRARDGIKYSHSTLHSLQLSRKRYYKALHELASQNLIHKVGRGGKYFHTTFGALAYQRNIVEMQKYIEHLGELKMVDTLRLAGQFAHKDIVNFLEKFMMTTTTTRTAINDDDSNSSKSSDAWGAGEGAKVVRDILSSFEMYWSSEDMVRFLLEYINASMKEILIATRVYSEEIIRAVQTKAALGVTVKIISDTELIESYFRLQNIDSIVEKEEKDDGSSPAPITYDRKNQRERINVVGNPWYPDSHIHRRITNVPYGIVIIDGVKAGIELVNSYNLKEFTGGILVHDKDVACAMRKHYERLWSQASEFSRGFYDNSKSNTSRRDTTTMAA